MSRLPSATGAFVFSHVLTGTGTVFPAAEIARLCRARGILTIVDGAHAPGAISLDFSALGDVDFYGGNLHKWMLGPKGTAFGWVSPRHHDGVLSQLSPGWTTFETHEPFLEFGEGSRFAAAMLMSGCHDFAPFFAITDLLAYREKQGTRIHAELYELQARLERLMDEQIGWPSLSPPAGSPFRGPLLGYRLPVRLANQGREVMHQLSDQKGLQVMINRFRGNWALRLSPHVYNSRPELERAVEILREIC